MAAPTPGTQNYSLVRASEAALPASFLNTDFDCADPTALNKKLIQGKILVCMWDGVPSFSGQAGGLSRVAAQAMGAVAVVLVTMQTYEEPSSPAAFDFQDFPGISIWGASDMQVNFRSFKLFDLPISYCS